MVIPSNSKKEYYKHRVVRFITHFVVGSAITAFLLPTTSSEISYTLAKFSNEFKNENHEGHDFCNLFNAKMQAVVKKKKIVSILQKKELTHITLAS